VWKEIPTEMERMATSYFKELFIRDPSLNSNALLALMQEKVTGQMNTDLCTDFIDDKISDAMFQIGPLKAPVVDGFPSWFYQCNSGQLKLKL
jgi:hypothetical protein